MVKKRRRNSAPCKFQVASKAIEGGRTVSQVSREKEIHPSLMQSYKLHLTGDGSRVVYNHERSYKSPNCHTPAEEHFVLWSDTVESVWMNHIIPFPSSKHWDLP